MMKRILALTLALVMLFSMTALALTPEEAARDLGRYGIMSGFSDGSLRLEQNVTRAQVAKMLVTAMNKTVASGRMSSFTDVPKGHWATDYIETAKDYKIIGGFPDGSFRPEEPVTFAQVVKMVVCMLKYDGYLLSHEYNKTKMEYPMDYLHLANRFDLIKGLAFDQTAPANRGTVAVILSRTLDAPIAYDDTPFWSLADGKGGRPLNTLRVAFQ